MLKTNSRIFYTFCSPIIYIWFLGCSSSFQINRRTFLVLIISSSSIIISSIILLLAVLLKESDDSAIILSIYNNFRNIFVVLHFHHNIFANGSFISINNIFVQPETVGRFCSYSSLAVYPLRSFVSLLLLIFYFILIFCFR